MKVRIFDEAATEGKPYQGPSRACGNLWVSAVTRQDGAPVNWFRPRPTQPHFFSTPEQNKAKKSLCVSIPAGPKHTLAICCGFFYSFFLQ